MDMKTIIIIALLIFGVYWYNNIEKGTEIIDNAVEQTQSFIQKADGLKSSCPETYDPVCADGNEFDNTCLAQKAGYTNMTLGVCPTGE